MRIILLSALKDSFILPNTARQLPMRRAAPTNASHHVTSYHKPLVPHLSSHIKLLLYQVGKVRSIISEPLLCTYCDEGQAKKEDAAAPQMRRPPSR